MQYSNNLDYTNGNGTFKFTTTDLINAFEERKEDYISNGQADWRRYPMQKVQIFNTGLKLNKYSDIEQAAPTLEGQIYNKTQREALGGIVLSAEKYTQSYEMTEESVYFTENSQAPGVPDAATNIAALYDSLETYRDEKFINLFTQMDSAANTTVYNGNPIASNSHGFPNSSITNDNLMDDQPLDDLRIKEGKTMLRSFRTSLNKKLKQPQRIHVISGEANRHMLQEVGGTPLDPFTANNTINVNEGLSYSILHGLPPALESYYWIVDLDRMMNSVIMAYFWMDRLTTDRQSEYGIPMNWLVSAVDDFHVLDYTWVVFCPATTTK